MTSNTLKISVIAGLITAGLGGAYSIGSGHAPVSYTHLDVYKRQLQEKTKTAQGCRQEYSEKVCGAHKQTRRIDSVHYFVCERNGVPPDSCAQPGIS